MSNPISPDHYQQGGIETIDYLEAKLGKEGFEGFLVGNCIKYLSRFKMKNGAEDVAKSIWYANRLKETLETNK